MEAIVFALVILITFSISLASSSLHMINNDGTFRSNNANVNINKLPSSFVEQSPEVTVFSYIDCGISDSLSVVNKIFSSSFDTSSSTAVGVYLDINDSCAYLYTKFDTMFSNDKFCGSKAIDYCTTTSNCVIIGLSATDLDDSLVGYEQIFRRLLNKVNKDASSKTGSEGKDSFLSSLVVLVGTTESSSSNSNDEMVYKVTKAIESIWNDISGKPYSALEECLAIKVIVTSVTDNEKLSIVKPSIIPENEVRKIETVTLGNVLSENWRKISGMASRAILSSNQRQSVYVIDTAYTSCLSQIESTIIQWCKRVGTGKVIGKFTERVQHLQDSMLKSFYETTKGTLMIKERAERANQLNTAIVTSTNVIFRQQVEIIQNRIIADFKLQLQQLILKDDIVVEDEQQRLLREALFQFRTLVSDIEIDSIGLTASAYHDELSSTLQTTIQEFPESPGAKLASARKLDKQAKKPKKKKGKSRAVNIGLNLIGMLRPPGFGNLQGYAGYSTGLLGLPLDIMMAVHNDGDAPEIMGEDREYPILRLQPKVHFDIDL